MKKIIYTFAALSIFLASFFVYSSVEAATAEDYFTGLKEAGLSDESKRNELIRIFWGNVQIPANEITNPAFALENIKIGGPISFTSGAQSDPYIFFNANRKGINNSITQTYTASRVFGWTDFGVQQRFFKPQIDRGVITKSGTTTNQLRDIYWDALDIKHIFMSGDFLSYRVNENKWSQNLIIDSNINTNLSSVKVNLSLKNTTENKVCSLGQYNISAPVGASSTIKFDIPRTVTCDGVAHTVNNSDLYSFALETVSTYPTMDGGREKIKDETKPVQFTFAPNKQAAPVEVAPPVVTPAPTQPIQTITFPPAICTMDIPTSMCSNWLRNGTQGTVRWSTENIPLTTVGTLSLVALSPNNSGAETTITRQLQNTGSYSWNVTQPAGAYMVKITFGNMSATDAIQVLEVREVQPIVDVSPTTPIEPPTINPVVPPTTVISPVTPTRYELIAQLLARLIELQRQLAELQRQQGLPVTTPVTPVVAPTPVTPPSVPPVNIEDQFIITPGFPELNARKEITLQTNRLGVYKEKTDLINIRYSTLNISATNGTFEIHNNANPLMRYKVDIRNTGVVTLDPTKTTRQGGIKEILDATTGDVSSQWNYSVNFGSVASDQGLMLVLEGDGACRDCTTMPASGTNPPANLVPLPAPTILVPPTPTYTLSTSVQGNGTITGNNQASYVNETSVTLTATPSTNSRFTGWTGACSGTSPTCTVTMNSNKSVTAIFEAMVAPVTADYEYGLSVSYDPASTYSLAFRIKTNDSRVARIYTEATCTNNVAGCGTHWNHNISWRLDGSKYSSSNGHVQPGNMPQYMIDLVKEGKTTINFSAKFLDANGNTLKSVSLATPSFAVANSNQASILDGFINFVKGVFGR